MFCCGGYHIQNRCIREILLYIEFLEAKYLAYYSKYEANRQHCKRFRIVTPEIKQIALTNCTNTTKSVMQTYVSILERAINLLIDRTYNLRLIFILIYYGQHNTLKAIPKDIKQDIKYKYPILYSSFEMNSKYMKNSFTNKKNLIALSSKKVRFQIK